MKIPAIALLCLGAGFAAGQATRPSAVGPRATGIGGVFFKAKDPAALKAWYAKNLGLPLGKYGVSFDWLESDGKTKGTTQWTVFPETTKYFAPSDKGFMINYRVVGLDALLAELKKAGVEPTEPVQRAPYGAFAHVLDPEGNNVELWEPSEAGAAEAHPKSRP